MTSATDITIAESISALADEFSRAGIDTPQLDARLLVQAVSTKTHAQIIANHDHKLATAQLETLRQLANRRLNSEPLSRILGKREFFGREFLITNDVLDPRPDTETVIEQSLQCIRYLQQSADQQVKIADLGTGSGAIAITLLCQIPTIEAIGVDISKTALTIAAQNAARHAINDRLNLIESDWCANLKDQYSLIVSNPPYIDNATLGQLDRQVRDYDPKIALDGGPDGLFAYRKIAQCSPRKLLPGSFVVLEIGFDQAEQVLDIFTGCGFVEHADFAPVTKDLSGNDRVITLFWR